MEGLDLGTILNDEEINRLLSSEEDEPQEQNEEVQNNEEEDVTETNQEEESESVSSNEDNQTEETPAEENTGSSDFFSSIASAFQAEGIFADITDEDVAKVKSAEDFRSFVEEKIKNELDEQQKRVIEALDNNVEVTEVKKYETMIQYLNSLTDDALEEEGEKGEALRRNLMMQDLINRGFSKERASKTVERSFENGTDIDDAKEALSSHKELVKKQYDTLLNEAKKQKEQEVKENQKRLEKLQKEFETGEVDLFKGMSLNKDLRKKAYEAALKPSYKDSKTGMMLTAVQKAQKEDPDGFLLKLGFLYSLTNGFTSFEGVVKNKVNKEIKKGFSELENKLNSTRRDAGGNLQYASGVSADNESFLGKGIEADW